MKLWFERGFVEHSLDLGIFYEFNPFQLQEKYSEDPESSGICKKNRR